MPSLNAGTRLSTFAVAMVLWLMLASIMGTTAYYYDSETAPIGLSASGSRSWVQSTQADFASDHGVGVDTVAKPGSVVLQGRTEFLYAFRGANTNQFLRFNTTSSSWTALANAPSNIRNDGSGLASDGDRYLYALQGTNRQFWRYDTLVNSWTVMPRTPTTVRSGGSLAYDGNGNLYATQGNGNTGFWRFNIAANSWAVLADTPRSVGVGGSLVADGVGHIYLLRGNLATDFWRYDIRTNSWAALASAPATVAYGGAMTFDGEDGIYALRGWYTSTFWRYSIGTNAWQAMAPLPRGVGLGASLAHSYPGAVYALVGDSTSLSYRYDTSANSWSSSTSLPARVDEGGAMTCGPMLFPRSGAITSVVRDTGTSGTRLVGLYWDEALPAGTDISFEIRASDTLTGGVPSASWVHLGGTSPLVYGLPTGQYVQWRATLTTANVHLTPILQEVRLYYV